MGGISVRHAFHRSPGRDPRNVAYRAVTACLELYSGAGLSCCFRHADAIRPESKRCFSLLEPLVVNELRVVSSDFRPNARPNAWSVLCCVLSGQTKSRNLGSATSRWLIALWGFYFKSRAVMQRSAQ